MKKVIWILFAFFAIFIGLYPIIYIFAEYGKFGYFELKDAATLANDIWKVCFYLHVSFSGLALFVGWSGFVQTIRKKRPKLHRWIGKIYVTGVLIGSISGLYIGFYGTGGPIAKLGFITGDLLWFYTTLKAYLFIRNRQILQHQIMMTYSYALCFGGVTLRMYSPIVQSIFTEFITGYQLIAWISWAPNLMVAYWLNQKTNLISKGMKMEKVA